MIVDDDQRYEAFLDAAENFHRLDESGTHERACGDADCPGWAVFTVDREPGAEIEKCDCCGRFNDDDEALEHVLRSLFPLAACDCLYAEAGLRPAR